MITNPLVIKYVDDFIGTEKIYKRNGHFVLSTNKKQTFVHARESQSFFKMVKENSESIGMSVNDNKTQMVCVSSSPNTEIRSVINTVEGTKNHFSEWNEAFGVSIFLMIRLQTNMWKN